MPDKLSAVQSSTCPTDAMVVTEEACTVGGGNTAETLLPSPRHQHSATIAACQGSSKGSIPSRSLSLLGLSNNATGVFASGIS